MSPKGKNDWQSEQHEHAEHTGAEVRESEEIKEDSETASRDWGEQQEPALSDTADELNHIALSLRTDIRGQHGEQAEEVDDAIETQRREVSEPARVSEGTEGAAADEFDTASSTNKRFGGILSEAADSRRDAEAFLREMAETDEASQGDSKETLHDHRQAVEEAIQNIRDL